MLYSNIGHNLAIHIGKSNSFVYEWNLGLILFNFRAFFYSIWVRLECKCKCRDGNAGRLFGMTLCLVFESKN